MIDWKHAVGEAPASFEARVQSTLETLEDRTMNERNRKRGSRPVGRSVLIAAGAAALLIGTAYAANLLRLDERRGEVLIPETTAIAEGYTAVPPAVTAPADIEYTTVNPVGAPDSPEYRAAREWSDWRLANREENTLFPKGFENYTQEELDAITAAIESDVYVRLGADTDEARAALDAIAAKYDLRLPSSWREISAKDFFDMTGALDILPLEPDSQAGTWFEGGALSITNRAVLDNGKTVNYDLIRSVRGVFSGADPLALEQGITEEWLHTTPDGTEVTLDLGPNRSALMAELPNSFVYVHIRGGTENSDPTRDFTGPDTLDRADLEAFADAIGFAALDGLQ